MPLSRKCNLKVPAGYFTVFGIKLLEIRVLHKGAWVAKLLGIPSVGSRTIKKVKFPCTV